MRRFWFPILLGVVGVAVLCALGAWQLRRLAWKEGVLAEIDARIAAAPVALPAAPDPAADRFLPVTVAGALGGEEALVLTSLADLGPGFRVVSVLTAGDRRVLVDLGYVPEAARDETRVAEAVTVTGNLHWPDEADSWTPAPDLDDRLWFARDVPAMAAALDAETVLVVARDVAGADLGTIPVPVTSANVPNDHLGYAVTWFGLAAVWAAMSAVLVRRAAQGAA
jgi:surfeit locus 1 family protein